MGMRITWMENTGPFPEFRCGILIFYIEVYNATWEISVVVDNVYSNDMHNASGPSPEASDMR